MTPPDAHKSPLMSLATIRKDCHKNMQMKTNYFLFFPTRPDCTRSCPASFLVSCLKAAKARASSAAEAITQSMSNLILQIFIHHSFKCSNLLLELEVEGAGLDLGAISCQYFVQFLLSTIIAPQESTKVPFPSLAQPRAIWLPESAGNSHPSATANDDAATARSLKVTKPKRFRSGLMTSKTGPASSKNSRRAAAVVSSRRCPTKSLQSNEL